MLTISNVSVRLGDHPVLDRVSFSVNKHDRIGLVGPNGAGKSTLLAVLAGARRPDTGSVLRAPGASVGLLRQGFADLDGRTLGSLLDDHLGGLLKTHERLDRATAELALITDDSDAALELFASATEAFDSAGGYERLEELRLLLGQFGLVDVPFDTPLGRLSGGEKTRAGLAALLATRPDVLLLDEPTNHLDIRALEWLETFVAGYSGAIVIVSHDRAFIDATANRIVELDDVSHAATFYAGNYSDFIEAKRLAAAAQMDAYERQQREIARIEHDVRAVAGHAQQTENETTNDYLRGRSKKVARTAKVRERKLERLMALTELIEKPERRWGLALEFAPAAESGRDVIVAENVALTLGNRTIFEDIDLHVRAGERVALTGPNGAGKSSLLRVITGQLEPSCGSVKLGASVNTGLYAQEQDDISLSRSALEQIREAAAGDETDARSFLHRFLFTEANVKRPAGELSYGERARLSLALLVRRGANLLILDEPLNHLDLQSRERFEEALLSFDGTVLTVLHDRYAIARLATRVLALEDGRLRET